MSKQANPTTIGAFIVIGLLITILAIVAFNRNTLFTERADVVMYFDGSVKGLVIGAPVLFRGVTVGSVTNVKLVADPVRGRFLIPVHAELEPQNLIPMGVPIEYDLKFLEALVDQGLTAQLELQSLLTGRLSIQLDMRPDKETHFYSEKNGEVEIPTIATPIETLAKSLKDINSDDLIHDVAEILAGINQLVNSKEVRSTIHDTAITASEARALITKLNGSMDELTQQLTNTLNQLDTTLKHTDKMVKNIDQQVLVLGNDLQNTLKNADSAINEIEISMKEIQSQVGASSPLIYNVNNTLEEVARAAQSFRALSDTLERHPEAILKGKSHFEGN